MKVAKSKLVIFSVAVAFLSVFFFAYAVQAFYPAPEYEDFCDREGVNYNHAGACEAAGGKWVDSKDGSASFMAEGWCDINYYCEQEYDEIRKPYERNVFFANLIIGIVLFIVAFFLGLEVVSSGLMGGAVMLMVYGSIRYWEELSDVWRTLMLGVALSILIYLGYKKLRD